MHDEECDRLPDGPVASSGRFSTCDRCGCEAYIWPTTRREMLRDAQGRLSTIIRHALDAGLKPDEIDCENIRKAHALLYAALREDRQ